MKRSLLYVILMEVMGDKSHSSPQKKMQVQLKLQFESDQEASLDNVSLLSRSVGTETGNL